MPELPDWEVYRSALASRILGQPLERTRVIGPFLLRTVDPPLEAVGGRAVRATDAPGSAGEHDQRFIPGRFSYRPRQATHRGMAILRTSAQLYQTIRRQGVAPRVGTPLAHGEVERRCPMSRSNLNSTGLWGRVCVWSVLALAALAVLTGCDLTTLSSLVGSSDWYGLDALGFVPDASVVQSANDYRQSVFDAANAAWDSYILE